MLASVSAAAQSKKTEVAEESDSIQLFRGVAVSYDIGGTVMRMVSDYGQYEAAVRFNLKDRYFPIIEMGIGSAKHDVDAVTGIEAKVNAPYGRIGCDFNVSKNKHDIYRVLVGARYALTSFKTEASATAKDPYWGVTDIPYSIETETCNFHWAELVFSVDAHLWGPVRLGWSFRYRMKIHSTDMGANELWYVPGYGKSTNKLGGTFNVTFELGRKNKRHQ